MAETSYLPLRTRLYIKRTPWLYRLAKQLRDPRARHLLCDKSTDICIEGYPSSGNSFSLSILRQSNQSIRIAHHCHSVANLQLALDYGIPAVCLIRHPESAISSRLARFGGNVEEALREYIDFYEFALRHIDRLVVVTFEEVTQDTAGLLKRLDRETGLNLACGNIEDLKKKSLKRINEWQEANGIPGRAPLPLAEREEAKAKIQQEIRQSRYHREAVAIWQRVMERVGS